MKSKFFVTVVSCLLSPLNAEAHRDRGSWKKTLHEKAVYFAKNTVQRHNIEGTYPSSVRLHPPNHYGAPRLGGAAYIQAYWLGRYEGFIDEEEVNQIWWLKCYQHKKARR